MRVEQFIVEVYFNRKCVNQAWFREKVQVENLLHKMIIYWFTVFLFFSYLSFWYLNFQALEILNKIQNWWLPCYVLTVHKVTYSIDNFKLRKNINNLTFFITTIFPSTRGIFKLTKHQIIFTVPVPQFQNNGPQYNRGQCLKRSGV